MKDPGEHIFHQLDETELEALVETMYLVAYADGHYGAEERAFFSQSVARLTGGRLCADGFDHVIARLTCRLGDEGHEGCVEAIKRRLPDEATREVALILAHDMAAADGVLHPGERQLILQLADAFDMPPDSTREVFEGPAA